MAGGFDPRVVLALFMLEMRRLASKRMTVAVAILTVLPLVVAAVLRAVMEPREAPLLWAQILGVDIGSAEGDATLALAGLASVFAWWWLITAVYSGDLLASDLQSGLTRLVLARPVTRLEYLTAKLLAVLTLLTLLALVGGVSALGAAWVLGGPQEDPAGALWASVVLSLGALPFISLAALIGFKTRKPLMGIVLAVVVYFVVSIVVGLGAFLAVVQQGGGNLLEESYRIQSLIPLNGGKTLAALAWSYHYYDGVYKPPFNITTPIQIGGDTEIRLVTGPIDLGPLLATCTISTIIWGALLTALLYLALRRADL